MQRLNYFATLWYWLYGFPRVVYLVAPLFFLLRLFLAWFLRNLLVGRLLREQVRRQKQHGGHR